MRKIFDSVHLNHNKEEAEEKWNEIETSSGGGSREKVSQKNSEATKERSKERNETKRGEGSRPQLYLAL